MQTLNELNKSISNLNTDLNCLKNELLDLSTELQEFYSKQYLDSETIEIFCSKLENLTEKYL